MMLLNKGKQSLINMFYGKEHAYVYIERKLLMDAEIPCEYSCYPTVSLCFKASFSLHNFRQLIEYRALKC